MGRPNVKKVAGFLFNAQLIQKCIQTDQSIVLIIYNIFSDLNTIWPPHERRLVS